MFGTKFLITATVLGVASFVTYREALADTLVSGTLNAYTPCALVPSSNEDEMTTCLQAIVPIAGRLTLTSNKGRRIRVSSTSRGTFSVKLPQGRYTIKLSKVVAKAGISAPDAKDLRLLTDRIVVKKKALDLSIAVVHRSYLEE